jgi:hypothetical protein
MDLVAYNFAASTAALQVSKPPNRVLGATELRAQRSSPWRSRGIGLECCHEAVGSERDNARGDPEDAAMFAPAFHFGRILAAYGGIFVAGSLAWGMIVDKFQPDRWDYLGAAICLIGVAIIMYAPRS